IAVADASFRFKRANGTFCALVGLTENELKQKSYFEVVYPEDLQRAHGFRNHLWEQAFKTLSWEGRYHKKDGSVFWGAVTATALARSDPDTESLLIAEDVSSGKREIDQQRVEARSAKKASLAKTEFLAHMSHEIRSPLSAIIGFGGLLQTDSLSSEDQSRYLG